MPLPPPPATALIRTGKPIALGLLRQMRRRLIVAVIARHDRHAGLHHQGLRGILEPHRANGRRRRPDEHQPRLRTRLRKGRILRQEAVARMHGLRARRARRLKIAATSR